MCVCVLLHNTPDCNAMLSGLGEVWSSVSDKWSTLYKAGLGEELMRKISDFSDLFDSCLL